MYLGIVSNNHDASLALVSGNDVLWAAHAERYSRIKNDSVLNRDIIHEMLSYGTPTDIVWFENPIIKSTRQLLSHQKTSWRNHIIEIKKLGLGNIPIHFSDHHLSHASAGYFTSGFNDASILVIDAIGEWDTVSIWNAAGNKVNKVWKKRYPDSIGLFYSAMTSFVGLKPNEEEYILMGMAAYGEPIYKDEIKETFFKYISGPEFKLRYNMHKGCSWWTPSNSNYSKYDIAASVQSILEDYLLSTVRYIKSKLPSNNLVLMGGLALNCVANSVIARSGLFKDIWIMPNPGDAGSSIGCIASHLKKQINWETPFLGTNIDKDLDIRSVVNKLKNGNIVGIANGRAEFGPRALGNRSLICDPRGPNAKSLMNSVKKREQFRPFAPAVIEEVAHQYFDVPVSESRYMQYVSKCLYPEELPGICHVDGTSRVQTVVKQSNSQFRHILEEWYKETGCPVLMNTSLNIKHEPLVNTENDAMRFSKLTGVQIF